MQELKQKHCVPCESGTNPLSEERIREYVDMIPEGWQVKNNKLLVKSFSFENFKRGMAFVQNLAIIAESEQHHPNICIRYKDVEIELTTNDIGGLSENDFIMAAKIEEL